MCITGPPLLIDCGDCEWHINVTMKPSREEFCWRRHGAKVQVKCCSIRGIYQSNEGGDTQGDAVTMYHEGYSFICQEGRCIVTDFISKYIFKTWALMYDSNCGESSLSLYTITATTTNTTTTIYNLYSVLLKSNPKTCLSLRSNLLIC